MNGVYTDHTGGSGCREIGEHSLLTKTPDSISTHTVPVYVTLLCFNLAIEVYDDHHLWV